MKEEKKTLSDFTFKPAAKAAKETIEKELSKYEEDNTGLRAVHTTEQTGSSAFHAGKRIYQVKQHHKEQKADRKKPGESNVMSKAYQKKDIQKGYRSAKSGKKAGNKTARKAASETREWTEKTTQFVVKHRRGFVLLLLGAMLVFIIQGISACSPIVESGLQALVIGTYPATEDDVRAAERVYANKEKELKDELDHYERYHPGYDHYDVEYQEIWHDPYALIAIISAVKNGEQWTIDDAMPIIEKYFAWQYVKTETITTQTKYRTETVDGEEVSVPYTETTCTVRLKNKKLSYSPVYTMSHEQMGMYALYMSTHGNMDGIFRGKHCSELKDPTLWDVPQEYIDADPKFALLLEEANKRIGYPYVWGGYTPETSFDCSGFVSWVFTSTGVRNIGHAGATGLYNMSRKISAEEALPGDVVFFTGTLGEGEDGNDGITHCGLYVGDGWMIHCGSPCTYGEIYSSYFKNKIVGFGRLYER